MSQQQLFPPSELPPSKPQKSLAERKKEIAAKTYAKQKDAWKTAVLEFAEHEFLPEQTATFLCEDLREAYERYARFMGLPNVVTKQAWAGIPKVLKNKGLILNAGGGFRKNGVRAELYSATKKAFTDKQEAV